MGKDQLLLKLKEKLVSLKKLEVDYCHKLSEIEGGMQSWSGAGFRAGIEEEKRRVERELTQTQEQLQELEGLKLEKTELVCPGCLVTLDFGEGEIVEYRILKSAGDPAQKILSSSSPIGQAVLGKKVGEVVEVQTPQGSYQVKIVALSC